MDLVGRTWTLDIDGPVRSVSRLVRSHDRPPTCVDLIHLDNTLGEGAHHISGMMQMTGLILVEFGQCSEWVWGGCCTDDVAEWLDGCRVCLEERDFGVAVIVSCMLVFRFPAIKPT